MWKETTDLVVMIMTGLNAAAWLSATPSQAFQPPAKHMWEYSIATAGADGGGKTLNEHGKQGWELVSSHVAPSNDLVHFTFKRPK